MSRANSVNGRHFRHGYMLLENTCALFVISVGLFGTLGLYLSGQEHTRMLEEHTLARHVLVNELETLRSAPEQLPAPGDERCFTGQGPEWSRLHGVAGTVRASLFDEDLPRLREVTVSIGWVGEHGRRMSKTLTTLMEAPG